MNFICSGNTADIYEYDSGRICKVYKSWFPEEYITIESCNAAKAAAVGIRVPEYYGQICVDGRVGSIFEHISGNCLSECDGCDIEKQLSELHLDLLEHCGDGFIDYRDFLIGMIMAKTNGEELLKGRIRALPDGKALLHGDFHPGNVMLDSGGGKVIIDLMNMCCGPKEFDITRTFFC